MTTGEPAPAAPRSGWAGPCWRGRTSVWGSRTQIDLDVYNVFNSNAVTGFSTAYAAWLRPPNIRDARFATVGVQFDF